MEKQKSEALNNNDTSENYEHEVKEEINEVAKEEVKEATKEEVKEATKEENKENNSWMCDKCMNINFGSQKFCVACGDRFDKNDEVLE